VNDDSERSAGDWIDGFLFLLAVATLLVAVAIWAAGFPVEIGR